MKETSHAVIYAGSLSLHTLQIMKTDSISQFNNEGDFTKCSIDNIDNLFPKKRVWCALVVK